MNEKFASIPMVYTRDGRIVGTVAKDMDHRSWSEEVLASLKRTMREFRRALAKVFDEQCHSGLYIIKYHAFVHMLEELQ